MLGRHAQPSNPQGQTSRKDSNLKESRPPTPADSDHHRSFSNEATPRPTPAQPRLLAQESNSGESLTQSQTSKRLGFFADKLSGNTGSTSNSQSQANHTQSASTSGLRVSPVPHSSPGLLPPRSHSRADSTPRDLPSSTSMTSLSSNPNANANSKVHTSPSKTTTGRTYDARLVSREMHRLGNLTHLPTHLPTSLTAASSASVSTLTLPTSASVSALPSLSTERDNPFQSLHVHVLPLFNGEPLRVPIEDLNTLVRRHIQSVVSLSPSKALSTLENDAAELIASGMVTLNSKFMNIEENKLLARVVDMWGFFWDQVLPYVEGALLPLQTDPLLASLYRNPKTHRTSSPTRPSTSGPTSMPVAGGGGGSKPTLKISSMGSSSHPHIDVRTVALRGFRDQIILPLFPRLYARLSMPNRVLENHGYLEPRCNQMMLVLAFQTRQPSLPPSFSLTSPAPQAQTGPGEKALADLICALRLPSFTHSAERAEVETGEELKSTLDPSIMARAPSFLSAGVPRDRRGRIAQKKTSGPGGLGIGVGGVGAGGVAGDEDWDDGGETPRNAFVVGAAVGGGTMDRNREREFLEGLRSPDPISSGVMADEAGARASVGGWGLGLGGVSMGEDAGKAAVEEDEYDVDDDEPLTWDEAQLMVENIMIYTSKMSRLQEDHAGASAIRDVPGRMFEAYERKGFAKDRIEAEKQAKKDLAAVTVVNTKPGRKMT